MISHTNSMSLLIHGSSSIVLAFQELHELCIAFAAQVYIRSHNRIESCTAAIPDCSALLARVVYDLSATVALQYNAHSAFPFFPSIFLAVSLIASVSASLFWVVTTSPVIRWVRAYSFG